METICIIGSRITTPEMKQDLQDTLYELAAIRRLRFSCSGCAGICAETIKYCVRNDICHRLNIWLAKRIRQAPIMLRPLIEYAGEHGACVLETEIKNYLFAIIVRNLQMIRASDICFGWRLNESKGTTHEISIAEHYGKTVIMNDYTREFRGGQDNGVPISSRYRHALQRVSKVENTGCSRPDNS